MAARHKKGSYEKNCILFDFFLLAKDYRMMSSGGARGTVFQEIQPRVGFETGDFVQEKLGGLP